MPSDNDYNIITHIDGADIFFSAFRFKNLESFDKIDALNKQFSKMINEKYPGAHIIVKTGIYVLKTNEVVGVGLDKALKAKKTVKNPRNHFALSMTKINMKIAVANCNSYFFIGFSICIIGHNCIHR